jgi:hypothetical protein
MGFSDLPRPKEGKHYRFRNQLFWAVEGAVVIEDQNTGEVKFLSIQDAKLRAFHLHDQVKEMVIPDERDQVLQAVIDLAECRKEAMHQGDCFNPAILAKRNKQDKRSIGMVSGNNSKIIHRNMDRSPTYFLPQTGTMLTSEKFAKLRI